MYDTAEHTCRARGARETARRRATPSAAKQRPECTGLDPRTSGPLPFFFRNADPMPFSRPAESVSPRHATVGYTDWFSAADCRHKRSALWGLVPRPRLRRRNAFRDAQKSAEGQARPIRTRWRKVQARPTRCCHAKLFEALACLLAEADGAQHHATSLSELLSNPAAPARRAEARCRVGPPRRQTKP